MASLHLDKPVDAPAGANIRVSEQCAGSIDSINGVLPSPAGFSARGVLQVRGWLAISGETPRLPRNALLVLGNPRGGVTFIETSRVVRPDVGAHFGSPLLQSAGYSAVADVSQVTGDHVLGLAFEQDGLIEICSQFRVAGRFNGGE
ncbi:hypothetical protein [Ralstonia solanacearum]|uniref:hypothetical protein n=1 Tax=Ralstonia solanacearum TaxID=305 RepID=UPI001F1526DF|nr:hypothetical protein [Ralstonia solanacearum]